MSASPPLPRVAIVRDPLYQKHSNGPHHPECPQRLQAIDQMLAAFALRDRLFELAPRDATFEELSRVHDPAYLRRIEATRSRPLTVLDPDTSACADSHAAAVRAAGGLLAAVDAVQGGQEGAAGEPVGAVPLAGAFALVRPPGHHAEAGQAMGFCLFNNVAIAAHHALSARGLERVLIVDWDVHHGNGTMHAFYDSDRVLFFSVHQFPHYPGTGRVEETGQGRGLGFSINVPLPSGQGDAEYLAVFRELLLPVALEYRPQLVLVSAGFDTHADDPLAGMEVSTAGFGALTGQLLEIADACCPGRLVFALEGGYDVGALAGGVEAVLRALLGAAGAAGATAAAASGETREVIARARRLLGPFWKSLPPRAAEPACTGS